MECAAEADGIRVNTVHPGVIDTPIWTKLPVSAGSNAPIDPNEVAKAGVPLGRTGQAQDIANAVRELRSVSQGGLIVRIPFPPAGSLQTLGPSREIRMVPELLSRSSFASTGMTEPGSKLLGYDPRSKRRMTGTL